MNRIASALGSVSFRCSSLQPFSLRQSFHRLRDGSDVNPCTTILPCRSFGVALAHTTAGGESSPSIRAVMEFTISHSVKRHWRAWRPCRADRGEGDRHPGGRRIERHRQHPSLNITPIGDAEGIEARSFEVLTIENCTSPEVNSDLDRGRSGVHATVVDTAVRDAVEGFFVGSEAALVRCRAESSNEGLRILAGLVSAVDS